MLGLSPALLTFDRSPREFVTGTPVPLLTTVQERSRTARALFPGMEVITVPFDRAMMTMPWEDFVVMLSEVYRARWLVAGHDFHFGRGGEGNPQRLAEECARLGMGCDIIPRVELDGVTVSSTHIRGLVERGELEEAGRFLGHPFVLSGPVVHGSELGRTLGTPTANLLIPPGVIAPGFGVYAAKVEVLPVWPDNHEPSGPQHLPGEGPYLAVTNVGVRPTVNASGTGVTVEPWILDFSGDLYGRSLRLELHKQLRGERKFSGVDELRAAILDNAAQTRAYFAAKKQAPC